MMLALFLWFLVGLVINGKTNEGRIEHIQSNVEVAHSSSLESGGPFCQSVVAYYEGTLKNQFSPNLNYTVQFQIQMSASQSDKRIYVVFDRWNQTLAPTKPFSFDFAYDEKDVTGNQIGSLYWGPFASNPSDFTLTLNHETNQKWDNSIRILYFDIFNNSFQLENAVGQCTAKQLELVNVWDMDPTLIDYCVCCGDYLPSEELGCPVNPWSEPMQTTTSPPPAPISCQSVVGYYDGVFKNDANPDLVYSAQFQVRITSDLAARQYQLTVEGWNETVSRHGDFSMLFYYYDNDHLCDDMTVNRTCSAPFRDNDREYDLYLYHGRKAEWDNAFDLLYFDPFNHTFTFDAIEGCTANPPNRDGDDYAPDPTLYKSCLCCDNYNPDPSLNCPKSPWT